MKKILFLSLIITLLAGCTSSTKYLARGEYDEAIEKSVKKLIRKPANVKEINVLKKAYNLANTNDQDYINRLKLSGQPDIWDEVFNRLRIMNERQGKVERLQSSVLNKIDFKRVDYNNEIALAKTKAADYYYAHGVQLLEKGDRISARQAYTEFQNAKRYYPNYKEVDAKIQTALFQGTNNVLFRVQNKTRVIIPKDFESDLLKISLKGMNRQWLNFDTYADNSLYYDFTVYLNLKVIDVSPEKIKEINYEDTKTITDGWEYKLDNKGNVMKDSAGNDIKIPKKVTIRCKVIENQMDKRSMVSGTLDFYDNRSNQLVHTQNITTESVFQHSYANFRGDERALSDKSKGMLKNRPIPFPSDLQMISNTAEDLKRIAKDIISQNSRLFSN